jgi:hypothetical protein
MKNAVLSVLICLAAAAIEPAPAAGAGEDACVPLPAHERKINRHGHANWFDEYLRVSGAIASGVEIPPGWVPIGADRFDAGCAWFPPRQATLFVKPEFWQVESIHSPEADLILQLLSLKSIPPEELDRWRELVVETYRDVTPLFPLGLTPDQALPHVILVTSGIAGDGARRSSRLFPEPGPNLTNLFYNPGDGRGRDLFIHTTTHLFNKRRPRPETLPNEDGLSKFEYRELVATWAEIAFNPDAAHVHNRVAFLMRQHVALTDGDPDTWPDAGSLAKIKSHKGPFGLPPAAPENSAAAREYAHYYLGPLVMLAIDGLLAKRASGASVGTMIRDIHAGDSPGLLASLRRLLPDRFEQIRSWMDGTGQVPAGLVERGLARVQG